MATEVSGLKRLFSLISLSLKSRKTDLLIVYAIYVPWIILGISIDDASLALLAFVLLMWVTLPWAFVEIVNKGVDANLKKLEAESVQKKIPFDELKEVQKPKIWLARGTNAFLYAGIWFLVQWLVDFANILFIPYPVFFVTGVGFLVWGIFETYRTIQFVLSPSATPELVAVLTTAKILALSVAGLYIYIFATQLYYKIYAISTYNEIIDATFPIALLGVPLMWRVKHRDRFQWRNFVPMMALIGLPVFVIFLILLYLYLTGAVNRS